MFKINSSINNNEHKSHFFNPYCFGEGPCVCMRVITAGFDVVVCPEFSSFRSGSGCSTPLILHMGNPAVIRIARAGGEIDFICRIIDVTKMLFVWNISLISEVMDKTGFRSWVFVLFIDTLQKQRGQYTHWCTFLDRIAPHRSSEQVLIYLFYLLIGPQAPTHPLCIWKDLCILNDCTWEEPLLQSAHRHWCHSGCAHTQTKVFASISCISHIIQASLLSHLHPHIPVRSTGH